MRPTLLTNSCQLLQTLRLPIRASAEVHRRRASVGRVGKNDRAGSRTPPILSMPASPPILHDEIRKRRSDLSATRGDDPRRDRSGNISRSLYGLLVDVD